MTKTPNRKSGFVLVEVLISVTILLMLASTSIGLVTMGYRAINFNAHSLEATWLAQQGANSLRGLRDTNWLRFGYDKANCWKSFGDTCPGGIDLIEGNYIIDVSLSGPIELTEISKNLDLSDGTSGAERAFQLAYTDRDDSEDSDDDGDYTHDKDYLAHKAMTSGAVSPSIYYRIVKITKITTSPDLELLEASVEVHWLESSVVKKIVIPVTLTNYYREA